MALKISDDEAAVYDRQIRLWGLDAQTHLRQSYILVLGAGSLCQETLKNLSLAGVGGIDIWDEQIVDEKTLKSALFLGKEDINKKRSSSVAQHLSEVNTYCHIQALSQQFDQILLSLNKYTVVLSFDLRIEQVMKISHKCAEINSVLFVAESRHTLAYFFLDLGSKYYISDKFDNINVSNTKNKDNIISIDDDDSSLEEQIEQKENKREQDHNSFNIEIKDCANVISLLDDSDDEQEKQIQLDIDDNSEQIANSQPIKRTRKQMEEENKQLSKDSNNNINENDTIDIETGVKRRKIEEQNGNNVQLEIDLFIKTLRVKTFQHFHDIWPLLLGCDKESENCEEKRFEKLSKSQKKTVSGHRQLLFLLRAVHTFELESSETQRKGLLDTNTAEQIIKEELRKRSNAEASSINQTEMNHNTLIQMLNLPQPGSDDFPVTCAVVGGFMSQEIVNAITHKCFPRGTVFMYDASLKQSGIIYYL
ncbi:MAG: putative SUMO-1 activating enzyme E1 N subunit [Streblomastix strix]|uniref:Putative SUMO-1 activating enzyme E1 N subunit n=1 Tax=Streblomastix strix TaxID=222440 RepID=A0A5J4WSB0_9EUKA|nr:MAG: putative SUMO-1 activating enzyme E1 N subunit [Streblomastix strix]